MRHYRVTMTADPAVSATPAILEPMFAPLAGELLRDYYTATTDSGRTWFTGARFETLGERWNEPSNANRITAGDVVAVSCLSVRVQGAAAIRILETEAEPIGELLAAMPRISVPLWEVSEAEVGPDSAAGKLWQLLRSGRDGLGPTTVSKLLARKRADLAPIYDSVVASALGMTQSGGHWARMRGLMLTSVDGAPLHERLGAMATDVGLAPLVTPLRVFDVLVWYAYNPEIRIRARVQEIAGRLRESGALGRTWAARP
jgi:hypothetical protein